MFHDITNQTRKILGSDFVDKLLSILGLGFLTTGTAVPLLLFSGEQVFKGGLAEGLLGNDIIHLILKLGIVGVAPHYIGLPVLLTIIIRLINNFKDDSNKDQTGGSLFDQEGGNLFYQYISHAESNDIYSIHSPEGKSIVKQYVMTAQKGGLHSGCSSCSNTKAKFYNSSKSQNNGNTKINSNFQDDNYSDAEFIEGQEGGWGSPVQAEEDNYSQKGGWGQSYEEENESIYPQRGSWWPKYEEENETIYSQKGGWQPRPKPIITAEEIVNKIGSFFKSDKPLEKKSN